MSFTFDSCATTHRHDGRRAHTPDGHPRVEADAVPKPGHHDW